MILLIIVDLQPCLPSESVFGDGLDNDCDGDIDEELCTGAYIGSDTDSDGRVDEDCAINREIGNGKILAECPIL